MFKLLYIYDFSFKFVKMKCRKIKNCEFIVIFNFIVSNGMFMDGYNVYWG